MTQVGDLVKKLKEGTLTANELASLQNRLNEIDQRVKILQGWIQPGGIDPNVGHIHAKGGFFDVLPHEAGSLHGVSGGDLTIPTTSWTTVVGSSGAATWNKGFKYDAATGRIYCGGVPRESVLAIFIYAVWQGDMHGQRVDLAWRADDDSAIYKQDVIPTDLTTNYFQFLTHCRRTPTTETYYYCQVAQYTGSDKHLVDFNFVVARIK
jgi:hypothetical protein